VENYVGQYALANTASNNISGVVDAALFGNTFASYADIGTQGTLTVTTDGANNNAYQIVAGNPLGTTYNFQAYLADANTVLLIGTDKTRVLAGFVSRQSQ
jgi:urate oxidase